MTCRICLGTEPVKCDVAFASGWSTQESFQRPTYLKTLEHFIDDNSSAVCAFSCKFVSCMMPSVVVLFEVLLCKLFVAFYWVAFLFSKKRFDDILYF